jgi:hypothetical protein
MKGNKKLEDNIILDNNYYLKVLNNNIAGPIDIEKLKLITILKDKKLLLKINFSNINEKKYKKILKKLLILKKIIPKTKIGIQEETKTMIGYVINYDKNNKQQNDFISAINAIFYNTRYERYNYIYDTVCNYLDNCFYGKNLCDFQNNKCGEKRNTSSVTGCCHHFKPKWLGPLSPKMVLCEYLSENYTCNAKCISCKLFTCDYLNKKGVKFRIKDILLLDVFFNNLQKYFIKYMVFTKKEKIIKRLMHT